ncbi:bifunctional alpha/beta hydrolase/OsmC family protein [Sediminicola luteus]|uniref:Osmotically inducible protein C n=1 Tax=Sediminicola luteus TaxID=319238 RepID=A0A2A4G9J9_9FLAO|nr:bifunctional alpha/beta hydrolase/OsmC family protein [Sediminicola luteus]PCE64650.1 osmotically inducible protein C [Sediminicola luteus]
MPSKKLVFTNLSGQQLVGRLELPVDSHPHNFALFAHCFTCTKNLSAVRHISKALTAKGFGVFRFDFTGLGESEGDFADTNFSGNIDDLIAASRFLETDYQAPSLIIGHSLGGAAVILAANQIPSVKAVATIGAPADPEHVTHLLQCSLAEIESQGVAQVDLGGRPFTIKKQFVDDLRTQQLPQTLKQLKKPLLILHAPQDRTVEIKNAELLYMAAHHPKSFISLDGADHLLSSSADSQYAGHVIAGWAERYLTKPENKTLETQDQVVARLDAEDGYTTYMKVGRHNLIADEPISLGGNDFGPSPYELVSAGLSSCSVITVQMYARRKGWPLDSIEVHTNHRQEKETIDGKLHRRDIYERKVKLSGNLDDAQRNRLLQIADKCPVHKSLKQGSEIISVLVD